MDDGALVGRIVANVRAVDPSLAEPTVRDAVARVARSRWARRQLVGALEARPQVLTSGRPDDCPAVRQLIEELVAAGSVTVSRPHCTLCRRIRDLPMPLPGGGRVCAACRDLLLSNPCPSCGSWRRLTSRRGDGSRVCQQCGDRARKEKRAGCPICGVRRRLSRQCADGTRICQLCDRRELAEWTRGWHAHFRRDAPPAVTDETRTGWIMDAVAAADPALPAGVARAAVRRVAPSPEGRNLLARELLCWPQRLIDGRPDSSPVVQRLITELVDAGSTGVRRPSCTLCRRVRDLPMPLPGGGRICGPCHRLLAAERCPGCGRWVACSRRRSDGAAVCTVCARRNPARWEPCVRCGRERPVVRRTADGPRCSRCRPEPDDLPCTACGRTEVARRRYSGVVLCRRCAVAPARICAFCRLTRVRVDPDPGCPRCGLSDPLECSTCGDTWFSFGHGVAGCYLCRLHRRVARLADGADAERVDRLRPFLQALQQVDDPRRGLEWLTRGRAAQQLAKDLLHGRSPVEHATLDAVNATVTKRSTSVEHLRHLLVASGVLAARDEPLHRLEETIDRLLASTEPTDQAVLRQWAVWHVLPRVRRRIDAGRPSAAVLGRGTSSVTTPHHFLRWLRQHGASLDQLRQADVDQWTADHLEQAVALAAFLRWAARRHHVPRGIRPPSRRDRTVRLSTSQDELYAAARRCLTDATIPPGHRLAVGLVVLYGQPLTRICRLRVSDLQHHDDGITTITLGRTPLALLPPLAAVARTVADTALQDAVRSGVSTGFTNQPVWLFPGLPLTKHAHPTTLSDRIVALLPGNVRSHRNTALLTLTRDVPPVVLADLLGLHPGTVERWRTLAGGSLATYAAARLANKATDQSHSPTQ